MQSEDNDNSVAGRIARLLSQRIVSGALEPGAPVRQDHVAAEFRASHVPVREAFRTLEAGGLLVSEPRRGVRVAALDPATISEVTEMRACLETLALRYASGVLGKQDLAAASDAIERGEASNDIAIWERANRDFHRAITAPCRMPRLIATIDDLHRTSARFLYATWKNLDWQPRSDLEHRAILAALEMGDVASAEQRLRVHIIEAGKALIGLLAPARA